MHFPDRMRGFWARSFEAENYCDPSSCPYTDVPLPIHRWLGPTNGPNPTMDGTAWLRPTVGPTRLDGTAALGPTKGLKTNIHTAQHKLKRPRLLGLTSGTLWRGVHCTSRKHACRPNITHSRIGFTPLAFLSTAEIDADQQSRPHGPQRQP